MKCGDRHFRKEKQDQIDHGAPIENLIASHRKLTCQATRFSVKKLTRTLPERGIMTSEILQIICLNGNSASTSLRCCDEIQLDTMTTSSLETSVYGASQGNTPRREREKPSSSHRSYSTLLSGRPHSCDMLRPRPGLVGSLGIIWNLLQCISSSQSRARRTIWIWSG